MSEFESGSWGDTTPDTGNDTGPDAALDLHEDTGEGQSDIPEDMPEDDINDSLGDIPEDTSDEPSDDEINDLAEEIPEDTSEVTQADSDEDLPDEILEDIEEDKYQENVENQPDLERELKEQEKKHPELDVYGKKIEKEPKGEKESKTDRPMYMGIDEAMDTATEEEKTVYSDLPLEVGEVDGRESLLRPDDDFLKLDEYGQCALDTTQEGKTAILDDGDVTLHHIGQMNDSPLAELTRSEHQENTKILHDSTIPSQVDRSAFDAEREDYWKARTQDIIERNIVKND